MKNWVPARLFSRNAYQYDREKIVERSVDLVNNDPNAAGITEAFATTIVGAGLRPQPRINAEMLGIDDDEADRIAEAQKYLFALWEPFADVQRRLSFGAMTYLAQRNMIEFGEYLFLVRMVKPDPLMPFALRLMAVNPLRLRTPSDKVRQDNMHDGVEVDADGAPRAYWIKKSERGSVPLPDTSKHFLRIPARRGHRVNVLHGFISRDPEQVRGIPEFAAGMKFFRDMSDYLDAELVANVVTAAFSMFIELSPEKIPLYPAQEFRTDYETVYRGDGTTFERSYQEMVPGQIMYGNAGEKPHVISAQRPGATFEPFVRTIAKSLANSVGVPHPVLFRDFEGMNYASYRSAMLEAWRVFKARRVWLAQGIAQPTYRMLIEEAYLRGRLKVRNFYSRMAELTAAEWIGPPKGQIEPVKEVQADVIAIQNNLKSREETILERGGDLNTTFKKLGKEQARLKEQGLDEQKMEITDDEDGGDNGTE